MTAEMSDLLATMKRSVDVLRGRRIPFVVCGRLAVYARGGAPSEHDVDFLIRGEDVDAVIEAFDEAGFRTQRPPEGWLVKAFDGEILVDLIFRPVNRPVTPQILSDADILPLAGVEVPVLSGTELLIHGLLRISGLECDFTDALAMTRAIREQIDIDRVREETKGSPYARAFLQLADELDLTGVPQR